MPSVPQETPCVQCAAYHAVHTHYATLTHFIHQTSVLATRLPALRGKQREDALRLNVELHEAMQAVWPAQPSSITEEVSDAV